MYNCSLQPKNFNFQAWSKWKESKCNNIWNQKGARFHCDGMSFFSFTQPQDKPSQWLYKAQGKSSLSVSLAGNTGAQCARAHQGEKRIPSSSTQPQGISRKLLIDLTGWKESEKWTSLKEKDRSFSRKFARHFNSFFYTSTGLVPCLLWEIVMEKHMQSDHRHFRYCDT